MDSVGFLIIEPDDMGYWGIDTRWRSFLDAYYAKTLPAELVRVYDDELNDSDNDFTGIKVLKRASSIRKIVQWMQARRLRFEAISIFSDELACRKGKLDGPEAEFVGIDVVSLGEWSLIRASLDSTSMRHWWPTFNQYALFDSEQQIDAFVAEYLANIAAGNLEQIAGPCSLFPIERISIGRPRIQH